VVLLAVLALLAPGHTLDLSSGRVDGHAVLGRSVAGVTASLGRPDFRAKGRIGWGTQRDFSTEVLFRRSGGELRAWSIVFERGPVRAGNVGDLLGLDPRTLRLPGYDVVRRYRCVGAICSTELEQRDGPLRVVFGTQPRRGTWLTLYAPTR
jgi:hypothetical protein